MSFSTLKDICFFIILAIIVVPYAWFHIIKDKIIDLIKEI